MTHDRARERPEDNDCASPVRISPEMSLGRRVPRRATRARDSWMLPTIRSDIGETIRWNSVSMASVGRVGRICGAGRHRNTVAAADAWPAPEEPWRAWVRLPDANAEPQVHPEEDGARGVMPACDGATHPFRGPGRDSSAPRGRLHIVTGQQFVGDLLRRFHGDPSCARSSALTTWQCLGATRGKERQGTPDSGVRPATVGRETPRTPLFGTPESACAPSRTTVPIALTTGLLPRTFRSAQRSVPLRAAAPVCETERESR